MRSRFLQLKLLVLFVLLSALGLRPVQPVLAHQEHLLAVDQFDLLDESSGWVLSDARLFWTPDMGESWREIGPSVPADAVLQDVEFLTMDTGWMLWSILAADGSSSFQLAYTADQGASWDVEFLALFETGEVASFAENAGMGWLDDQHGWIAVKQATGSNFSVGTLFRTGDGGKTWRRAALPVADEVYFSDPQTGWAAGGPTGDQIFETKDSGNTWQAVQVDRRPGDSFVTVHLPVYADGQGVLVTTQAGPRNSLDIYTLDASSTEWSLREQLILDIRASVIGLSILDPANFVAVIPGSRAVLRMEDGKLDIVDNQDGLSASIVELDMASADAGWGKSVEGACVSAPGGRDQAGPVTCSSNTSLLRTLDGGMTWQRVDLPPARSDAAAASSDRARIMEILPGPANTEILIGQGFDTCEIPTLSQLQAWSGNSPYQAVNLYIGGSSRACSNNALTASFLRQAHQQGWRFIPTWVGPQAPCTGYLSRMSSDPATAFGQGVAEANLAVERLAALGLTYPDKTGSVVYYDIEHYGTGSSCRAAVNSFMEGWVTQLHARGNLAGVYGSTLCNTGLSDFLTIGNVPDVIWPARWYHNLGSGYHDPEASVWDLGSCIPNTAWSNHQRIRQYEGDHNESWGNVPLHIDSNVLDGVVAIPHGFFASSIDRSDSSPTGVATVHFTVQFPEPVTGVDIGDFTLSINGVSGAAIVSVSGSGSTYLVAVNTGSGNGTLRLDLIDDDSIRNGSHDPLGGAGSGNGNFTHGKPYAVIKSATFDDIDASHWAWPYIERLFEAGITGGCSNSPLRYCPDTPVTRAEMAVFLERGIRGPAFHPPSPGSDTGFADVPPNQWAAAWIRQLAVDGVTGGCGAGMYCPDAPVTRAEMAVFLLRARYAASYEPPPAGSGTGFVDVPPDYWAAAWIRQLVTEGITAGCGSGTYCPEAPVTRAQMAVFLVKTFGLP
jgi:photosystem II stability/assembly factor-like uncharacterized protein